MLIVLQLVKGKNCNLCTILFQDRVNPKDLLGFAPVVGKKRWWLSELPSIQCKKNGNFARVHLREKSQLYSSNVPGTRAVSVTPFMVSTQLSQSQIFDPALTLEIQMSSLNGQATV